MCPLGWPLAPGASLTAAPWVTRSRSVQLRMERTAGNAMKVLVTGTAGFIGSHVAQVLLARGDTVIGFDSLNDYYDVTLKQARLGRFIDHPNYIHVQADLADRAAAEEVFAHHKPERVINL